MDTLVVIIILFLGFKFSVFFNDSLSENDVSTLKKLWYYHVFFGVYYCFFVWGDSIGYWHVSSQMNFDDFYEYFTTEKGTNFLLALNYFPSKVLGLSYFAGTMLYTLIGYMGITFFYVIAVKLVPYNSKFKNYYLFPILFFLPNLHFWSCGIGKDTILFFCIGGFVFSLLKPIKRLPLIVLVVLLSYFIRPHITLFLALGFGITYLLGSKVSSFQRIFFSGILIIGAIIILPTVMEFARIEETTIDSFNQFSESKATLLSRDNTGSRIDISSYPFPLKVFTFLFRPLFFDINGIPALLASFENLLLLILTFTILKNKPQKSYKYAPFIIKGLLFFLIIGTLAFSQSLGNLGIMIRMRNMFLPGFIIYILWAFSYFQNAKEE